MYQCLCDCIFSLLLGVYTEVELLSHVATLCLSFCSIARPLLHY